MTGFKDISLQITIIVHFTGAISRMTLHPEFLDPITKR